MDMELSKLAAAVGGSLDGPPDLRIRALAGIEEARIANVQYTEQFCTNLLAEVEGS